MKNLAYWSSKRNYSSKNKFLNRRKFIENLSHIDQIWDYLKKEHPELLAVNDLRGRSKVKLSYLELANNIEKASRAFFALARPSRT